MPTINAFAALQRDGQLEPWSFDRRELRPRDVAYDVMFCGICHTDLHSIGPWGQHFPLVPGHEVIGRVTEGALVLDLRCLEDEAGFIATLRDLPTGLHAVP